MTTRYRVKRNNRPGSGGEKLLAYIIVGMIQKQGFSAWIDEDEYPATVFVVDIHPDLATYFIDTMEFCLEHDETVERID